MPAENQTINLKLQRKRDNWEIQIKAAYMQLESNKRNFNLYQEEKTRIVARYEAWLERNGVQPILNLDYYK